jgi:hypothetical protein
MSKYNEEQMNENESTGFFALIKLAQEPNIKEIKNAMKHYLKFLEELAIHTCCTSESESSSNIDDKSILSSS